MPKTIMGVCSKLAIVFFAVAVLPAIIRIMLGTALQYTSYLNLFNAMAMAFGVGRLVSFFLSIKGFLRENIGRYRYSLLIAGNLHFLILVLLD